MMFLKEGGLFMPTWEKILVFIVIVFSVSSIYVFLVRSVNFDNNVRYINITTEKPSHKGPLVLRSEWMAQQRRWFPRKLSVLPPPYVIISHTVQSPCFDYLRCRKAVQLIQQHHMNSLHWADIGYNFVVGGDGNVYEGRGWDVQGAHALLFNNCSIGISFIGNFNIDEPVPRQLLAAKQFIEQGVNNGKISADYKLLGHRQVSKTESPGEKLYKIIQTWDHWSAVP